MRGATGIVEQLPFARFPRDAKFIESATRRAYEPARRGKDRFSRNAGNHGSCINTLSQPNKLALPYQELQGAIDLRAPAEVEKFTRQKYVIASVRDVDFNVIYKCQSAWHSSI